jgi:2-polyprenyl-3-methyl-5-hydroxy-6-metoxy-1,4-benzoquinol methylase
VEEQLYRKFYEVETSHWWFVARQRIVHHIIDTNLHLAKGAKVLDIGCGTGAILASFSQQYDAYGTDTSPLAIEYCKRRGLNNAFQCTLETFPHPALKFDLILLLDVIEHVDDDLGLVSLASHFLTPGGTICITVPAYQFLWSRHDDINFHKRRYVKSGLRRVLESAGLTIDLLSYFNTILFPPALVGRFAEKVIPPKTNGALEIPAPIVNSLLTETFEFEKHFIGRIPIPFGLSIISLAHRPTQ